jgi:hypothetical protein
MTNVQKILISVSYKKTKLRPMKKSVLTLLCLACISQFCFLQNTFLSSGTVGIGISLLDLKPQLHTYRNTTSKEPLLWLEDDNSSGYSQMEFRGTGKIFRVGVGNSEALATYANKFYIVDAGVGRPRLLIDDEGTVQIGTSLLNPAGGGKLTIISPLPTPHGHVARLCFCFGIPIDVFGGSGTIYSAT